MVIRLNPYLALLALFYNLMNISFNYESKSWIQKDYVTNICESTGM